LILDLQNVSFTVSRGTAHLLENVNFSVRSGERLAIIGASGAGKSTLLRLLNRLQDPTSGEIFFEGQNSSRIPVQSLRREIVLVPQEPKLLEKTVREALSYPLVLQKRSPQEILDRLETWTSLLQIPADWLDRSELQLSLGQRQLIAIARGLMLQPKILLLDEPTSALDMGTATRLLEVLGDRGELTLIMINHQLEFVKTFCQRVIYLQGGRVLEEKATSAIDWNNIRDRLLHAEKPEADEWDD
jgi:D-methionine transport system ATP-binding protein